MTKYYFSEDGKIRYGDKYSHLAKITVELPEAEVREGFTSHPAYNPETGEGYWEYNETKPTTEEELEKLKKENESLKVSQADQDEIIMQLLLGGN
jgi:hypothetical protein